MAHITFVHGIGSKPAPDDLPAQRSQKTGQAPYPSRALFTDEPTKRDRQRQRRSVARRGVGQRLRLRGERHVRQADLVDDDVASSRLRLVDTINTDGISLNFPHHDDGVLRHVRWPSSHAALGKSYAALRNRALSNGSCHSQMSRFGNDSSPSRKHV